jgi:PhnB protein
MPGKAVLVPYLRVNDAEAAIAFYMAAFGATETMRYPMPDGKVGFAELDLDGATLQLADADYERNMPLGGPEPISLHFRSSDVDAVYAAAIAGGATSLVAPTDDPNSGRRAQFRDPFGHRWIVAERVVVADG